MLAEEVPGIDMGDRSDGSGDGWATREEDAAPRA
jgi:hypothetical protein